MPILAALLVFSEKDLGRLRFGQTVRAVFREERTGSLADLLHFAPVEGQREAR